MRADGQIYAIDSATGATVTEILDTLGSKFLVASPDGAHIYVADSSNAIGVISTSTNSLITHVTIPFAATRLAVTADGTQIFGTLSAADQLIDIWAASLTITKNYTVSDNPIGVAVAPDGKHVYVANQGPSELLVADGAESRVTAVIPFMQSPVGVVAAPSARSMCPTISGTLSLSSAPHRTVS